MSTKLGTILADFTTALSTDIAVGGTTATLSSATDDDGVALPSGRYFFTLDGSNSSKEHISCDLVGTALTNIKSLSRQGVETTGAVRKHRIGTSVSLTDFGHIKFINDLVSGGTTLNSLAPLGYDGAPTGLAGNQLATVTYVLGVVNGGTVTFDQQIVSNQTSGEALTANDIVYFKESDAKWYKVDADLTATFDQLQMGVAQTTVAINTTVTIGISGPMTGFTGLTPGSKYYASNTAGAITTSAGTYSVFVGWALSATILLFDSVGKTLPTQKEKDALIGSQGVPSSTNKYVTSDNVFTSDTDQTQTTQNSSVEFGEANTTTKKNLIAQSFVAGKTKIRGVSLYKSADTGTFTGTVNVALQADTTGSPSGSDLASITITNASYLSLSTGVFQAIFSTEYQSLTVGSLYWIVITTSTSDTSNHPNLGINTAGGYSSGSVKYKNTTDGWTAIATIDLYFKTLQGTIGQIGQASNRQLFATSGTWYKPTTLSGDETVLIQLWGAGGGGGGNGTSAGANESCGGGGGGSYNEIKVRASQLSSTVAVTIGAGGAGGVGVGATGSAGAVGGTTTFGSYVSAYGGGGGGWVNDTVAGGGGGGGALGAGFSASGATGGVGGSPNGGAVGAVGGIGGAGGASSGVGGASLFGGAGGGFAGQNGGASIMGGGGGGGGYGSPQSGGSQSGAGGISTFGGTGGAGGAQNADGNVGIVPGGGGGGSNDSTVARTGGAGASGQAIITVIY